MIKIIIIIEKSEIYDNKWNQIHFTCFFVCVCMFLIRFFFILIHRSWCYLFVIVIINQKWMKKEIKKNKSIY